MEQYTARFQQMRNSGETVAIDGTCLSACTMVLGLVPLNRVCATPNAVLGFHAAWMYDNSGKRVASASGTRDLMETYPAAVRAWIERNGGLKPNMMYLRGRALAAIVAPCDNASHSASTASAKRVGAVRQASNTELMLCSRSLSLPPLWWSPPLRCRAQHSPAKSIRVDPSPDSRRARRRSRPTSPTRNLCRTIAPQLANTPIGVVHGL